MALTFNTLKQEGTPMVTVDRRLWLDADGNLVEDGDPAAAFLWAGKGREVRKADADEAGYKPKTKKRTARKSKSD